MSLSSNTAITTTHASSKESTDSLNMTTQPFTPGQCLFCSKSSPSFTDSVMHMQKTHGLFVPYQQHLIVDLETLFRYLHLVIFGYRECIHCSTERSTVQAVQHHMTGKGHCKFDISEPDSEFAEFYDFSEPEDDAESDIESDIESDGDEVDQKNTMTSSSRKPEKVDEDSIRLPSGRVISRHPSTRNGHTFTQPRRRTRTLNPQLEYTTVELDEEAFSKDEWDSNIPDTRVLSKREKREKAMVTYQLTNMSANDRNSLMHLPASQQLSILAAQNALVEKVQKEEKRRRSKVDRKGNKNLYAYWHTETPVYTCG